MDSDDAGHGAPTGEPAVEPPAEPGEPAAETPHDWAAIRQAYCDGRLSLAEIEKRFGVQRSSIYHRIDSEGWPRRMPKHKGGRSPAERMLARLKTTVERRISEFEAVSLDAQRSAADLERETRGLAALVKLMDKIVELEAAARNARHGGARRWSPAELDRRREELAQKLIKMLEQERGSPLPD